MQSEILQTISQLPAFQELLTEIRAGNRGLISGLPRAARPSVLSALRTELDLPLLVLTDKTDRALVLESEWDFWHAHKSLAFFPEPDPLFYEKVAWTRSTRRDRLRILSELAALMAPGEISEHPPLIIAPIRALMTRTLPRRDFLKSSRKLKTGDQFSPNRLAAEWISAGYENTPVVTLPGQFARRGGILDIWPPGDRFPARLEFFGDEIDQLRLFDPQNQRTIQKVDLIQVTPAREFLLPFDLPENDPDWKKTEYHLASLHSEKATLLNYLPKNSLIIMDNRDLIRETAQDIHTQAESLRKGYQQDQLLAPDFPLPYLPWEDLETALAGFTNLSLGPVGEALPTYLGTSFTPNQRFGGELKTFSDHLVQLLGSGEKAVVISRQSARLEEVWRERVSDLGNPIFIKGSLDGGWILTPPDGKPVHIFTDGEVFGWRRVQPRRRPVRRAQAPEVSYSDFQEGDWVVHMDHGIGRYAGLVFRELDGIEGEYLAVEYDEGDQLFVPASQADRLTRYVGPDHHDPSINRLGSARWGATKSRVKKEVVQVAQDLLDLYARRQTVGGYAFKLDTAWQQELEASFPYIETEDQLQVLTQVKADMESAKPMDRLICGDVGYGKTEIAVRAAFKAVMDGKQVAVLVPTTVLAQQHYDTFLQRMGGFPVEVRMLSRYRTPQQQQAILNGLYQGSVDIVIGTHRLLSRDVLFKDLGLMIVDEEQRFGVSHKEQIKSKRADIDVLTLTATPIPRTMYMALTGVRDISRINTPPDAVRGVGPARRTSLRRPARTARAGPVALALVLGVGAAIPAASAPVEALGGTARAAAPAHVGVWGTASSSFTVGGRALTPFAPLAASPSRADSALTRAGTTGSERIADLMREIRRVQARLEVASTQAQILAEERDDAATELADARSVASAAKSDLRTARKLVPSAIAANRSARKARRAAIAERRSARAASAQADARLATTQAHLDSLTQIAQRTEARVRRMARRVEKAATGTADWQKSVHVVADGGGRGSRGPRAEDARRGPGRRGLRRPTGR